MANILEFNGGKFLRADPSVIASKFATRLFNVDIDAVVLKSLKGPVNLNTRLDDTFYNFEGAWQHLPDADYVEYGNRLYYSRADGRPEKSDGISTFNLGIDRPEPTSAVNDAGMPLSDESGPIEGITLANDDINDEDITADFEIFSDADALLSDGSGAPGFRAGHQFYRICLIDNDNIVFNRIVRVTGDAPEGNLIRITLNGLVGHRIRIYRADEGTGNLTYRLFNEILVSLDTEVYIDYGVNLGSDPDDVYIDPVLPEGSKTVQYTITYYNIDEGIESAPMEFTKELETTLIQAVELANIPLSSDPQVSHINIYRLGGELTTMSMIAQLPNNYERPESGGLMSASPQTVAYRDTIADADIGQVLDTESNLPPDPRLTSLVEAYGIFFGMVGNELRFSEIDAPDYWPPENSFRLRRDGTGLIVTPQGILIFTSICTYLLEGRNISEFNLILLTDKQGCVSHRSCQLIQNKPLWISYEGVCTLENYSVNVLSKVLIDTVRIPVRQTEVFDEQYYILLEDGTISVMELKDSIRFYDIKLDKPITGIGRHEDKLYFTIEGVLHEAFAGEPLKLEYTSPVLADGNHSIRKSYNKIYIRYNGNFSIKMYIDGLLAQVVPDVSSHSESLNTTIDATFDFQPPVGKQRGYSCSFEIEGVGTIYSIETLPIPRTETT